MDIETDGTEKKIQTKNRSASASEISLPKPRPNEIKRSASMTNDMLMKKEKEYSYKNGDDGRKLTRLTKKDLFRRSFSDSTFELMKSSDSVQLNRVIMELIIVVEKKPISYRKLMMAITKFWIVTPKLDALDLQKYLDMLGFKITLRALKRTQETPATAVFRKPSAYKENSESLINTNVMYTDEKHDKIIIELNEIKKKIKDYTNKDIYWESIPKPYILSAELRSRKEVEKDMILDFGSLEVHNEALKKSGIMIYSFRIDGCVYRFPMMDCDHLELFLNTIKNRTSEDLEKYLAHVKEDNYENAFWRGKRYKRNSSDSLNK
jgi:superoxide dismutase